MKHLIQSIFALMVLGFSAGCSGQADDIKPSDTIYHGGDIITMEEDVPEYVEAIAIKSGKIAFVGSLKDTMKYKGERTVVKDLKGKTLLPGFIDAHSHFMFAINMVNQVNVANPPVGEVTDIPSLIEALKAFQKKANIAKGGWIVGWGYDANGLKEKRHITKNDLDPHFPDNNVMLIHVSGHGAVLNSNALAFAGIDKHTKTPDGGIIARLDSTSEPAGLLMETAYLPVMEQMPQPSLPQRLRLMSAAQKMYSKEGYTHAFDGATNLNDLNFLKKAASEQRILLDITALPLFTDMDKWLNQPGYVFGKYSNGLKLQGVKFVQDGSPQGKTAYVTTPYLTGGPGGEKNWYGEPTQPKAHFTKQVKTALDAGLQVYIHANGDAAIDQAIEAVQQSGVKAKDDRRTVVIHSQFQRAEQLDQYVQLGMSPTYFTNHTFFWGDTHITNIGVEKAQFISPIKSARAKGLAVSNHTDFVVTPLNPFFTMWTAMSRETRTGVVLGKDQRVDAYMALQALTSGPAWQIFEEHRKGMIKPGLLADLVVLSDNPLKTPIGKIKNIKVLQTIKENAIIYKAR